MDAQKYDRQIRLWATSGQLRLSASRVCLVNATALGCEVLKNLVLAGVGLFTILDATVVSEADLSSNFFLDEASLGSGRAEAAALILLEMNPDVTGEVVEHEGQIEALMTSDARDFWRSFSVVIVCNTHPLLSQLRALLWKRCIPLMVVRSVGFYGSVRVLCPELTAIETHPPNAPGDLRLDRPWSELQAHVDAFALATLGPADHAHVPYVVILIKALQAWKETHEGQPPQTSNEKRLFKIAVASMSRDLNLEVNFVEARDLSWRACQITAIPHEVKEAMAMCESALANATPVNQPFWILVAALKLFVHERSELPLAGTVPDMTLDTSSYVRLQQVYRDKGVADRLAFKDCVAQVLETHGDDAQAKLSLQLTSTVMETFCKNARTLFVSHSKHNGDLNAALRERAGGTSASALGGYVDEGLESLFVYVSLLAEADVETERSSLPELLELQRSARRLLAWTEDMPIPEALNRPLREMVRAQNKELHNTSALMGGIAGQEALKILMAQYRVLDNCFVWDGITSRSERWRI